MVLDPLADPWRRRRPGRRRRQCARTLPPVGGQRGPGGLRPFIACASTPGHRQGAPLEGAGEARPRRAVTTRAVEVSVRVLIASSRSGTPASDASFSSEDDAVVADVNGPRCIVGFLVGGLARVALTRVTKEPDTTPHPPRARTSIYGFFQRKKRI
jgi:hypothetical protein